MDINLLYFIAFIVLIFIILIFILVKTIYITGQTNESWRKLAVRTGLKLIEGNLFRTPSLTGKYKGFDCTLYIFQKYRHYKDSGTSCTGIDIKFPFQTDYLFKISGRNIDICNCNSKTFEKIITGELKNRVFEGKYPVNINIESYERLHFYCKGSQRDIDYILWLLDIMIEITERIYRVEGHQLPVISS